MTDKEFEDIINNPPKQERKRFKGTGLPGKQSKELVWSSNKDSIKVGEFGKQLAEQHFNIKANELWSKEDIRRIIDKENRENGK